MGERNYMLCQIRVQSKEKGKCNKTYIIDVELILLYYEKRDMETRCWKKRMRIDFLLGCIELHMPVEENIEDDQSIIRQCILQIRESYI